MAVIKGRRPDLDGDDYDDDVSDDGTTPSTIFSGDSQVGNIFCVAFFTWTRSVVDTDPLLSSSSLYNICMI